MFQRDGSIIVLHQIVVGKLIANYREIVLSNYVIQAAANFSKVVSKRSHPSLIQNSAIHDNVESFRCGTVSHICYVPHCISYHWNLDWTVSL